MLPHVLGKCKLTTADVTDVRLQTLMHGLYVPPKSIAKFELFGTLCALKLAKVRMHQLVTSKICFLEECLTADFARMVDHSQVSFDVTLKLAELHKSVTTITTLEWLFVIVALHVNTKIVFSSACFTASWIGTDVRTFTGVGQHMPFQMASYFRNVAAYAAHEILVSPRPLYASSSDLLHTGHFFRMHFLVMQKPRLAPKLLVTLLAWIFLLRLRFLDNVLVIT